jgi:hypothetical protein
MSAAAIAPLARKVLLSSGQVLYYDEPSLTPTCDPLQPSWLSYRYTITLVVLYYDDPSLTPYGMKPN